MSDLISKEKIRHEIAMLIMNNNRLIDTWLANCIDDIIDEQPTIEAVPLEDYRSMEQTVYKLTQALAEAEPIKHGRWIDKEDPYGFFDTIPVCSECGCTTKMREKYRYCPNCGAKMDEVE